MIKLRPARNRASESVREEEDNGCDGGMARRNDDGIVENERWQGIEEWIGKIQDLDVVEKDFRAVGD